MLLKHNQVYKKMQTVIFKRIIFFQFVSITQCSLSFSRKNIGGHWDHEDMRHVRRGFVVYTSFVVHASQHKPVELYKVLSFFRSARQSLYFCSAIIQSLFAMLLKYWQTNRNQVIHMTSIELKKTSRLLYIMKQVYRAIFLYYEVQCIINLLKFFCRLRHCPQNALQILSEVKRMN